MQQDHPNEASLLEEIERDPKAFFARTKAIGAEVEDLKAMAEARMWAQARWLSERNDAGIAKTKLAEMVGLTEGRIRQMVGAYRKFRTSTPRPSFNEAVVLAKGSTLEEKRSQASRSTARQALREQPEAVAPEIGKALEQEEVAEKVVDSMPPAAQAAVARMLAKRVPTEPEPEPEPPEPPEPEEPLVVPSAFDTPAPPNPLEEEAAAADAEDEDDLIELDPEDEARERRRAEMRKKASYMKYVFAVFKGIGALRRMGPLANPADEADVIDLLTMLEVEVGLAKRAVKGEDLEQEDVDQAYLEAEAKLQMAKLEGQLEDVDWDELGRELLGGEGSS